MLKNKSKAHGLKFEKNPHKLAAISTASLSPIQLNCVVHSNKLDLHRSPRSVLFLRNDVERLNYILNLTNKKAQDKICSHKSFIIDAITNMDANVFGEHNFKCQCSMRIQKSPHSTAFPGTFQDCLQTGSSP